MSVGIIAEFNPLHNGHKYLIENAKKLGPVIAVISGNFVQRGDTAIYEKRVRTLMALKSGVDLVLEMPTLWSMSTAQNFALGGVSILDAVGCKNIIFSSECGNIETLIKASDTLNSDEFKNLLEIELKKGITFAAARQNAFKQIGFDGDLLNNPNNNLGIEYITASKKISSDINFLSLKRQEIGHDSKEYSNNFASASLIRENIFQNDMSFVEKFVPYNIYEIIKNGNVSNIEKLENSILSVLRLKTENDLSSLPDLSEGLENKIYSSIKLATSLNSLYNSVKVKRYTLARIRRLCLSAYLEFDNSFFMKIPPYVRVLGFNQNGEKFLKENIKNSKIPVVMRAGDIEKLSNEAKLVFKAELRATDLYVLSLSNPLECGLEYTSKIIKTEC